MTFSEGIRIETAHGDKNHIRRPGDPSKKSCCEPQGATGHLHREEQASNLCLARVLGKRGKVN